MNGRSESNSEILTEPFVAMYLRGEKREKKGRAQPAEDCEEEIVTDSDRYQVYTHSVRRERGRG